MAMNISKEDIECCVCNDIFDENERRPKRLNCSHSVCVHCLQIMIDTSAELKCPLCNKLNPSVQHINDLADDLATMKLVQVMSSAMTCSTCSAVKDIQTCPSCGLKLCEDCVWVCYYGHLKLYEDEKKKQELENAATNEGVDNADASSRRSSVTVDLLGQFIDVDKKKRRKKLKKRKIAKDEIGLPYDFRHVAHVGYDPHTGYDINKVDPDMKLLFDVVGVTERELRDKGTAEFIHDFIEERGGMKAVRQEAKRLTMSKVPKKPERYVYGEEAEEEN